MPLDDSWNLGDFIGEEQDEGRVAIIALDETMAERVFTFAMLDEMARGVARGLLDAGLKTGDRVAIFAKNSAEYIATFHGIMRAGLVAVPVNTKFPRVLSDFVLSDSGAKFVFHDHARADLFPSELPHAVLDGEGEHGFCNFINPGPFASIFPMPDQPAMFLYTSGSSGRPKAVILTHRSHRWVVQTRLAGQDPKNDRILIAAPLYHMNGLALSMFAIAGQATIVLLPQFNALDYIEAIERYGCTWITAVPPMLAMMLREEERLATADLSSVRFIRMGSAPVGERLMSDIQSTFPSAKVTNAFGTTEGGPVVFGPHPLGKPTPALSVGCRHTAVDVRLVDQTGSEANRGVLEMRSPAVMLGYHQRPDLKRPITEDGYFITGDVFRRDDDGFYYFLGRSDDMFVSGGENIVPSEIEHMLETHPAIKQACVVPVDDDIKGQKPVAFVVLNANESADEQAIKAFTLDRVPAYQHPRRVWFIDSMPLAATNKIDRNALKSEAGRRNRVKEFD